MNAQEQKNTLRKKLLEVRKVLPVSQVEQASEKIVKECIELIPWREIKSFHSYVPINNRNEINTWPLLEYVWKNYSHVLTAVPTIQNDQIVCMEVDNQTKWQKNTLGIPQPINSKNIDNTFQFDVIIVPCISFDRVGHRLGYGKGHYDKFLTTQPNALTICIAYSILETKPFLPHEHHDVTMKYIATENETIQPKEFVA